MKFLNWIKTLFPRHKTTADEYYRIEKIPHYIDEGYYEEKIKEKSK